MLYAIARKGHVPKFLSLVHKKRHTPFASLLFIVSELRLFSPLKKKNTIFSIYFNSYNFYQLIFLFSNYIFQSTMSWIMLIPKSSNFASLLNYSSFINSAINGATMLALLWLRYRRPNMKRPFKVHTQTLHLQFLILFVFFFSFFFFNHIYE